MTYAQNNKIEYTDFNGIVGSSTTSTTGELNAIWGIGNGNKGYGQTYIPQVAQFATVTSGDWANVTNKCTTIKNHQGSTITSVTTPTQGARIDYVSAIPTNISTLTTNRLNAAGQGTDSTTTTTYNAAWSTQITFVHTVTFASGDAARYFFNAGGQIALTFSSPSGSGINALMNALGTACGTVVLSATTSGSITIASTSYNGITKVGGSGTTETLSTNTGYYALGTSNTAVFKQLASGTPAGYISSFITVNMRTNGTQGTNGDNGSVITITTTWDEVPNGLDVSSGTATTCTIRPPSTSYLTSTWGVPTVVGSVS
jgi:hypothetical protein